MSSVGYHEPTEELSDETRDMHRAIVSLVEELEAVDWYNHRAGPPHSTTRELRESHPPP